MSATFSEFLWTQLVPLPSVKSFARPLTGRTVLLTGGNVGLGLEAAKHLAALGPARLIITSRSSARGADALVQISAAGKGKVGKVECWEVNLAVFDSVKALVDRFAKQGGGKLDLLVLNAGVAGGVWNETPEGWEEMLQVNHLSTALLAIRFLPFLLAADAQPPTPRVVIVSSGVHHWVPDMPEVEAPSMLRKLNDKEYCEKEGKVRFRYPVTKLLNVLFTIALSSRLPSTTSLSINTVNPGFCHSQLARNARSWRFWLQKQLLARSTEAGSRTLVHAAVGRDIDGKSGLYVEHCRVGEPSEWVRSERGKEVGAKLWTDTIEELTLVDPEVPRIVKQYLA
ncbi:NAD(P)-binding protein [Calocera viscosa TUFC12733]|uniref:NAD(P)-binding protein n=1 Tax=Calocera viscosa (strain TUFC12733) TaxID=1330018 RepID=A0A167PIB0_CALVF|nr:NAD(P)-binding protein [Calocera viscosa TUFC12733]